MDVRNDGSETKENNSFENDSYFDKKVSFVDNQENIMAKSMPVNFSPAKFAFFYNDVSNANSTDQNTMDSFECQKFKNDKASFFRTDVLLSPKYRGKVNLFDSSFDDFETQLTKIDSIPIKSDESLDNITEKRDSSDLSSLETCSTIGAEAISASNAPDHSIFTLISPSKFMPKFKDNRLSVSSDSKVELMRSSKTGCKFKNDDEEEEEDGERTPTSQSFHDVSEEFLDKSEIDMTSTNLKKENKYSTIGTFNLDKKSPDDSDDGSCLRRIQRFKNIRAGNLINRFSKSQETYQLPSDPDDTSDLDMSRKEDYDFDDESVAISLDPMDCNYDSMSLVSNSPDNCAALSNIESSHFESELPNRTTSFGGEDADEDDVIAGDLVSFVRNFDLQAARDGRFHDLKNIKMAVEKIPNDEEFILGNSVQTKKKFYKKNFQLQTEERLSPTKHQNGNKMERSPLSSQQGNVESSPTSPLKKYTSAMSKNVSLKSPMPIFTHLSADEGATPSNSFESSNDIESPPQKSGASPPSKERQTSPEPCLNAESDNFDENHRNDMVSLQDSNLDSNPGFNELTDFPCGMTASQRMLLADFRFGLQKGSRERERPSAARLAKRLFNLQGFKRSDITRHLSKRNSFALLVGEELLKFFDFSGERLDSALKNFFRCLTFVQEMPCDKDRIVQHFANRYMECNPGRFESEALVHSLAYALLILDNDFNNQTTLQKITSQDFVENFIESQMNAGIEIPDSLSREFLHQLYHSVRNEPLELQIEELQNVIPLPQVPQQRGPLLAPMVQTLPSSYTMVDGGVSNMGRNGIQVVANLEKSITPDSDDQLEVKKGYIMRKCCLDANGRKTGLGRRGWKMFYAALRDTTLFLYSSERASKSKKTGKAKVVPTPSKSYTHLGEGALTSSSTTPKKSIGNSLKDRVLGKLSRSRGRTGSQETGISNSVGIDDEEESKNGPSIGTADDLEDDEGRADDLEDDIDRPNHDAASRGGTLPRESKTQDQGSKPTPIVNGNNAICLLHSIATKATDYIKKSHVLRLHTIDRAQYLIQTSDMKECQDWIDCINVVAALNSGPIPDRNFDIQKWFDRPITNLECGTLSIREQITQHERTAAQYEKQLFEYRKVAPEKGSRDRVIREYCHKENFFKFEIKRFKLYTKLLQHQLSTCPQLEPSLAETTIGEVEEPSCSPPVLATPPTFFKESPDSSNGGGDKMELTSARGSLPMASEEEDSVVRSTSISSSSSNPTPAPIVHPEVEGSGAPESVAIATHANPSPPTTATEVTTVGELATRASTFDGSSS